MTTVFAGRFVTMAWLAAHLVSPEVSLAQSILRFSLPFGQHAVGYRSVVLLDHSRNVPRDTVDAIGNPVVAPRPRPVHLSVWYPAGSSTGKPMLYRDYLALYGPSLQIPAAAAGRASEEALLRWQNLLVRNPGVSLGTRRDSLRTAIAREGGLPTHSLRDAPPDGQPHPLVLYAAGAEGPSFENDVLMEYLASLGYVAVGVPSWTEAGGPFLTTPSSLETQARDLELALRYARELPGEAAQRAAVIGWSWGGLASVVVASRNQSVSAVVGLDASVRYFWHDPALRDKIEISHPYATPTLLINQGGTPMTVIAQLGADTTFAFFESLRYADAYQVTMRNLRHQNFAAMYDRLAGPQPQFFVSDGEALSKGYTTMAAYVAAFLNAYLSGNAAAKQSLGATPSQLGLPDTNVSVIRKTGLRPLPTMAAFRAALGPDGWPQAPAIIERLLALDRDYTIHRDSLEFTGSTLLDSDRGPDGLGVYRVYTKLYPTDARAWNGLADAYVTVGDTTRAIAGYREALRLVPTNGRAISGLKRLGKSPTPEQPNDR